MKLVHLLQGRGVGHPLHPLLIHFPIAAFVLSFACDLFAFTPGSGELPRRISSLFIMTGVGTGLFAAVFGLADYQSIRRDDESRKLAFRHAALNVVVILLYSISLLIRYRTGHSDMGWPFLVSIVAFATLGYSGYLGGEMVYNRGVAVGRHRRRTELPSATIHATRVAQTGSHFAVCRSEEIREGESRRVDAEGTVFVVARAGEKLFAFQEFCTHRFAPLSEGVFKSDGQVVCPWHRSCFEMGSGAVKCAPAKEPLRTFPMRENAEGIIEVECEGGKKSAA